VTERPREGDAHVKVAWNGNEESVADAAELRALVARVRRAGRPEMLILEAGDGRWFAFGVGLDETVLSYGEADARSWHSRGDVERMDRLQFWSQGQLGDFMGEMAVAESIGLAAAEWFVTHGSKPVAVTWEADWDGDEE
jgi:hypothetical protein